MCDCSIRVVCLQLTSVSTECVDAKIAANNVSGNRELCATRSIINLRNGDTIEAFPIFVKEDLDIVLWRSFPSHINHLPSLRCSDLKWRQRLKDMDQH